MSYHVYLISNDGDGAVEQLRDWDGNDVLEFHLSAYANDAVISIEPVMEKSVEDEDG